MIESITLSGERTVTIVFKKEPISAQLPAQNTVLLSDVEKSTVIRALRDYPTLDEAAKALGINLSTLWRKRRQYGIQ